MDGGDGIKKAYEAIFRNDFEQAIHWFEEAIASDPDNAVYHYRLSITCSRSNRLAKALEHAQIAVKLASGEPSYEFHYNHLKAKERIIQAESAVELGGQQLYLALALLKEAITLDPLALEAYVMLGIAYAGLEEYGEAIQALKEALKLNPHHQVAAELLKLYKQRMSAFLGDTQES